MITPALYCDGQTLRSHAVEVQIGADGSLRYTGENIDVSLPLSTVRISPRLGRVPRFLRLPAGGVLEVPDDPAFDAALAAAGAAHRLERAVHWLESRVAIAAGSTLLLAVAVTAAVWLGLPWLARRAAYAVPDTIEAQAGRAGYNVFVRSFARSTLTGRQQRVVEHQLERLQAARAFHVKPVLVFVRMGTPNAFALPGGIIVVTDELYQLAYNEEELAAVLAHELGHVEKRHGLQSVLRSSAALIVVSTITGDLSTLTTFSGTLPFILLQYGYAREFEHEADDYAISLLRDARIDPINLARILRRLERERPKQGKDFSYLSSHPATEERIKFVQSYSSAALAGDEFNALHEAEQPVIRHEPIDRKPRVFYTVDPVYPIEMREAGVTGEVTLEFTVDTLGYVHDAKVTRSSRPEFEQPSLDAVGKWTFTPARRGDRAVNCRMQQTLTFTLDEEDSATPPAKSTPAR
ncbi:MAG: TonB family protein [Verrucomicrobia bacterium]|nr:TonB family protein [Verrucomicrobiota bacterium]